MTNKTDSVLFFLNINYIFSSDIYNKWKVITGLDRDVNYLQEEKMSKKEKMNKKNRKERLWKAQKRALICCMMIFTMIAASINVQAAVPTSANTAAAKLSSMNPDSDIHTINDNLEEQKVEEEATKPTYIEVPVEKHGIDVSVWNGKIDWQSVKDSGIDYAIIRIGYGGDIESQDDTWAKYNMDECTRLGIPFGVYIYSYATTPEKALSEADHVLRMISGYQLSYPVYLDMEDKITKNLGSQTLGVIASTFCSSIQNAGHTVGIYSNTTWFHYILTDPVFNNYPKWCAQYNTTCTYTGTYTMWQHSDKGNVPGIVGNVDMNISYETALVQQ